MRYIYRCSLSNQLRASPTPHPHTHERRSNNQSINQSKSSKSHTSTRDATRHHQRALTDRSEARSYPAALGRRALTRWGKRWRSPLPIRCPELSLSRLSLRQFATQGLLPLEVALGCGFSLLVCSSRGPTTLAASDLLLQPAPSAAQYHPLRYHLHRYSPHRYSPHRYSPHRYSPHRYSPHRYFQQSPPPPRQRRPPEPLAGRAYRRSGSRTCKKINRSHTHTHASTENNNPQHRHTRTVPVSGAGALAFTRYVFVYSRIVY